MAKTIFNYNNSNVFLSPEFLREILEGHHGEHHHHHHHKSPAKKLQLSIRNLPGQTIQLTGENMFTIDNTQQIVLTEQPVDADGLSATINSVPVWTVADPTLFTVTPAADGVTAVYASVAGAVGVTTGTVSAVNTDGVTITTPFDLTVTAVVVTVKPAVGFVVTGGTPSPRV